jgi:hypothetical protein
MDNELIKLMRFLPSPAGEGPGVRRYVGDACNRHACNGDACNASVRGVHISLRDYQSLLYPTG